MQTIPTKYPYRAVICGEKHIVKGWCEGNLVTDKGEFVFNRHDNNPILSDRLLEVALLQLSENGKWLLNGHNLGSLQSLRTGCRFDSITSGEVLHVYKHEIHAIAWVQNNNEERITEMLNQILNFWKTASKIEQKTTVSFLQGLAHDVNFSKVFAGWSEPIWLKEFYPITKTNLVELEIASGKPTNASVEAVEPTHKKAVIVRQSESIARFEDDYSIAVIPQKGGEEVPLTIENELRNLIRKIVAAGGRQPRTKLRSNKLDTYQPEKLLKSQVAKSLIKARLLGTSKSGRTTVFWVKQQHAG